MGVSCYATLGVRLTLRQDLGRSIMGCGANFGVWINTGLRNQGGKPTNRCVKDKLKRLRHRTSLLRRLLVGAVLLPPFVAVTRTSGPDHDVKHQAYLSAKKVRIAPLKETPRFEAKGAACKNNKN